MANINYTNISETPVKVTLTPYEIGTIIKSFEHILETNPKLSSFSTEARLYDEFSDILKTTYERLKGDCDFKIQYDVSEQTSKLIMSERDNKKSAADAELAEV